MLNLTKCYDLFKTVENMVDNTDVFMVYRWDDFVRKMADECMDDSDELVDVESDVNYLMHNFGFNNNNTLVFLYDCDNDMYYIHNYDAGISIICQNTMYDANMDDCAKHAMDDIFCYVCRTCGDYWGV